MVFSSTLFIFMFLPITLFGYYIIKEKFRNYWLLIVSLLFFSWNQLNYLWIILLNILINYISALLLEKFPKRKKIFLICSIIGNLGLLFYFKYFDFAINSLNMLFKTNFDALNIILPIGISFFTFQGMSYVIDVYRNDVKAQNNIFKVALYIVLFPQLIAGPIVRYKDVAAEINNRKTSIDDFATGIEKFIIGLSKKAIIANTMAVCADTIYSLNFNQNTIVIAWLGSIAYMLQIYFDFSGYSDMAIGLGRMFGFHFNENFNLPYISKNITEFWRRWHISLSSWFRDYVYIPLGGNRKHVYFNLSIVFLLTGIWHGASWTFILWGVWNGFFILIERYAKKHKINIFDSNNKFKTFILNLYTLFVINFGWILFRSNGLRNAIKYIGVMFGLYGGGMPKYNLLYFLDRWTVFILIIAILFSTSLPKKICIFFKNKFDDKIIITIKYLLLLLLLYFSMLRIVSGTYNPFIYFQF